MNDYFSFVKASVSGAVGFTLGVVSPLVCERYDYIPLVGFRGLQHRIDRVSCVKNNAEIVSMIGVLLNWKFLSVGAWTCTALAHSNTNNRCGFINIDEQKPIQHATEIGIRVLTSYAVSELVKSYFFDWGNINVIVGDVVGNYAQSPIVDSLIYVYEKAYDLSIETQAKKQQAEKKCTVLVKRESAGKRSRKSRGHHRNPTFLISQKL